ncbi:MAG: lytic transglycosylase domain-containing protein [Pseudomonadota bacterium]
MARIVHCFLAFVLCWLSFAPAAHPSPGVEETANQCDRAGVFAARRTGVPIDVLRAISLTETGRALGGELRPWPWTVNMEGTGVWFDSRAEALKYTQTHQAKGSKSFDVGCFQINHRWHGEHFASVEEMFDPVMGALYAARLLRGLHLELGSWSKAAGAYHSRTEQFATRYRARFDRILARLGGAELPVAALEAPGEIPILPRRDSVAPPEQSPAEPWVPPPPTPLGSVAGLSAVRAGPSLLTPARSGLF